MTFLSKNPVENLNIYILQYLVPMNLIYVFEATANKNWKDQYKLNHYDHPILSTDQVGAWRFPILKESSS